MTVPQPGAGRPGRSRLSRAVLAAIGFYSRAISPALPPRCRFYPTCSAYAAEAVEVHGVARGTLLALIRLLKCAPWHAGGLDPVPPRRGTRGDGRSSNPADRAHRSPRATPPATRRARQEESSVV